MGIDHFRPTETGSDLKTEYLENKARDQLIHTLSSPSYFSCKQLYIFFLQYSCIIK